MLLQHRINVKKNNIIHVNSEDGGFMQVMLFYMHAIK